MNTEDLELLINYIKNDDVTNFKNKLDNVREYNLSFGRFPLITVLYMEDSKKILKEFKKRLLGVSEYKKEEEPPVLYSDFKNLAKRCLRFFSFTEIISPYDILVLKGDNQEFEKISVNHTFTSDELERFSQICTLITGIGVKKTDKKVILPRRALVGARKKFTTATLIIFAFFSIFSAFCGIFSIFNNDYILKNQISIKNQSMLLNVLKSEEDIDFKIDSDFILDMSSWQSIDLTEDFDGNSHTITIKGDVDKNIFSSVKASIKNVNFVFDDIKLTNTIFKTIDQGGSITNSTFTFNNVSITFSDTLSIFSEVNYGKISENNFVINANFLATNTESLTDEKHVQFITYYNFGTISDLNFDMKIDIDGVNIVDYVFSTICASNTQYGTVKGITVVSDVNVNKMSFMGVGILNSGEIADTSLTINLTAPNGAFQTDINVIGYVATNSGVITNCTLNGNFNVTTETEKGSIYLSGIARTNNGTISSAIVSGKYYSAMLESNTKYLYLSGVVTDNYGSINKCKFSGELTAFSKSSVMVVGGICAQNLSTDMFFDMFFSRRPGVINNSIVEGKIKVNSTQGSTNVIGGIAGFCHYAVTDSICIAEFENDSTESTYVGGVIGTLANLSYSDEIFEKYFCGNVYLKKGNLIGVHGYYNNNSQAKYTEDLSVINGYPSAENIKESELYW